MNIDTYDVGDSIKYIKRLYLTEEKECDVCRGAGKFFDNNQKIFICPKCGGSGKLLVESKTEDLTKEGVISKVIITNNNGETGVQIYYKTTKDDEYMIPHDNVLSIIKVIDGVSYESSKKMYGN